MWQGDKEKQHMGDSLVSGSHSGAIHSREHRKRTKKTMRTHNELEVSSDT